MSVKNAIGYGLAILALVTGTTIVAALATPAAFTELSQDQLDNILLVARMGFLL